MLGETVQVQRQVLVELGGDCRENALPFALGHDAVSPFLVPVE
jgi:hypothetical protein